MVVVGQAGGGPDRKITGGKSQCSVAVAGLYHSTVLFFTQLLQERFCINNSVATLLAYFVPLYDQHYKEHLN